MAGAIDAALQLHRAGRLSEAEDAYRDLLRAHPDSPDVLHLLGALQHQRGEFTAAADTFRRALALKPDHAEAQRGLSEALLGQGLIDEAVQAARRGVERSPAHAPLRFTLAGALRRAGRLDAAIVEFGEAARLQPGLAEAQVNLASALLAAGRLDEAEQACAAALRARPDFPAAWLNLGAVRHARRQFAAAIDAYRKVLAAQPGDVEAEYSLGVTLFDSGDLDGAEQAYRAALTLAPAHEACRNNLAFLLQVLGRYGEATALYRRGVEQGPNPVAAARYLFLAQLYDSEVDIAARRAEQRAVMDTLARPARAAAPARPTARDPERRLRVAYLTSDFCDHPVGRNMEPLLAHRDRRRFETLVYADIARPDATTARLQRLADGWVSVAGLDDAAVAARLRADRIDILVVLAGHFDRNRPMAAAFRPAPVQVSFHDIMTSGLPEFDYFIADRMLHPRASREAFVERVIRLPSFYTHAPIEDAPPLAVRSGPVVFGSFNNPAKLNDRTVAAWADILRAAPGAVLQLKFRDWFGAASLQTRLRNIAAARGVDPARLHFAASADRSVDHLAHYAGIDIALDPFPFSGSTTSFEALWMGVPVVTLAGETAASRWSAAMLHALGLDRLVATDMAGYVALATALARDADGRATLRTELRARLRASPLCDGALRARQIERIYRAIWRRSCIRGAAAET